jgi:hypothetical protein
MIVPTFGAGLGGSRYVLLLLVWVHTRSCLPQQDDGNGGFEFSTCKNDSLLSLETDEWFLPSASVTPNKHNERVTCHTRQDLPFAAAADRRQYTS